MILEYKLIRIGVQPQIGDKPNVVAHAQWLLTASRSGFSSISFVDTLLLLGDLANFTPIEQLTKQQILDWCVAAEGGQAFIDSLVEHHERIITSEERRAGVELYTGPLSFALDEQKNQNLTGEMPVEVL
jgi:hypothetical protein